MHTKQRRLTLWLVPALALSATCTAQAAGDAHGNDRSPAAAVASAPVGASATGDMQHAGARQMAAGDMRASEVIGKEVVNSQGEKLGHVKDFVVDTVNGDLRYAVISFGGFLGVGNKLFAYPIEKFKPAVDRDKLVLDVDRDRLKSAPGFDETDWPSFSAPAYRGQIDRFHGTEPAPQNARLARASQIIRGDVKDRDKNDIGDIEDLVVNLRDGSVRFVVLAFEPSWRADRKLVAMPMKLLKSEDRDDTDLVYQASREHLRNAPAFDRNRWPNLADQRFREGVERYQQTWINNPAARAHPPHRTATR